MPLTLTNVALDLGEVIALSLDAMEKAKQERTRMGHHSPTVVSPAFVSRSPSGESSTHPKPMADSLFYVGHFYAVKLYPILETLLCRAAYPAQILLGTHAQVGQWSNSLAGPAFPLFASVSEKALVPPPAVACPPCPCGPRIYMRVPSRPPASHPILCFPVDQCLTNCKAVYGWLGKRTGRDGKRRR